MAEKENTKEQEIYEERARIEGGEGKCVCMKEKVTVGDKAA